MSSLPLRGEHLTVEKPVDLCITQARYTQLHRPINNNQDRHFYFVRQNIFAAKLPPRVSGGSSVVGWFQGTPLSLLLSLAPLGLRGARAAATLRR
jgi:hypothetical protein